MTWKRVPRRTAVVVICLALNAPGMIAAGSGDVRWVPKPGGPAGAGAFEVTGLGAERLDALTRSHGDARQCAAVFAVFVERKGSDAGPRQNLAGRYEVRDGVLRFTPRYPLVPGLKYCAEVRGPVAAGALQESPEPESVTTIAIPAPPARDPTRVVRVSPTQDVLPENQLKFYVYFSAPMQRGDAYRHIHLEDLERGVLDLPFLEIGEELWDPAAERVTLLFDPGRIKQGLKPREEEGPILVDGHRYRLTIDNGWRDAQGSPLADKFEKAFRVEPADVQPPDPRTWKVDPPVSGTREPLKVRFGETLDAAMLGWALQIRGADDRLVGGIVHVVDDATSWEFRPESTWTMGAYRIAIDTSLEDLAGNNLRGPFEVDVLNPIDQGRPTSSYELPFRISPPEYPTRQAADAR